MQFDQLNQEGILESITSPVVMWFIFGLFLVFYAVVSIILVYHWRKYGHRSKHIAFAELVYFPISFIFIGLISFALIMYTTL